MKWHQAKCTHQESCICDIRSHVLILCTEHETLKRVSDYAQIIKPSAFAWLVGETGYKRWQTSKIKTTLVQFMLETDFARSNVGLLIRLVIVSEMFESFEPQIMISYLLQLAGSKIKLVPCQVDPCSLSST